MNRNQAYDDVTVYCIQREKPVMSNRYIIRFKDTLVLIALIASLFIFAIAPSTAQDSTTERNREAFLRVIEVVFNARQTDVLGEIFAPEFVNHSPNGENNREGSIATIGALVAAMPDLTMTPVVIIAEGDYVTGVSTLAGTFNEPLHTPDGAIPPNGQPVSLLINSTFRFNAEGLAVEEWLVWDNLSLLTQLGVLPASGEAADDPESVIHRFYEFFNVGDFDSQLALWADDAELALPDGTVLRGREEIATFQPDHAEIVIEDLIVDGTTVSWTSVAGSARFLLQAVVEDGQIQMMQFR